MSYTAWTTAQRSGAALLLELRRDNIPAENLERDAGIDYNRAKHLVWLAKQFELTHLKLAKHYQLSTDQLDAINKYVNRAHSGVDKQALREEFIRKAPECVLRDLRGWMAQRVTQENGGVDKRMPPARFNLGTTPDAHGRIHFSGWLMQAQAHMLRNRLNNDARSLQATNPDLTRIDALGQAAINRLLTGTPNTTPTHEPCFILPLDADTTYFADGTIATSDGALINIHNLINEKIADYGYTIAWGLNEQGHPTPVAAARIQHTTPWQKYLAAIEHLTCVHPHCDHAAITSQGHHITAWSHGGPTTYDNLAPLCQYHNRRNSDNPNNNTNGRIEKDPETGIPGLRASPNQPLEHRSHRKSMSIWATGYYLGR
ncbi:HNH endonuclease signature motif containing protein [Corynebacterium felinum]|uniref:HNH nuclease domain-containing protein n=1 Tax=Corynebacterium felinum TaxID=131318 RepID=A0ABU2B8M6_9CORY|nr:HNH endonuclease signature motif containing protein [Corynebacterium felinum]MDF5820877.1 HNH endonuclease signature motif containing protein [Corynebacterium felinum]MDR7354611.1 hypothetical protein [Corynebacterium felinum]